MEILNQINQYLSSLDWNYILTFILLSHVLNNEKMLSWVAKVTKLKIETRYRVLVIGFFYGILLFFIRGYTITKVECLMQSFVFAMVFHKLILEKIIEQFSFKKQNLEDEY